MCDEFQMVSVRFSPWITLQPYEVMWQNITIKQQLTGCVNKFDRLSWRAWIFIQYKYAVWFVDWRFSIGFFSVICKVDLILTLGTCVHVCIYTHMHVVVTI
jgi:hypothetical protein